MAFGAGKPLDGACPVHQRKVSSVFGLHSLGCWNLFPICDHSEGLQALPNVPFRSRSPSVKDRGEAEAVTFQRELGSSWGAEGVTGNILRNLGPTVSQSLTEPETWVFRSNSLCVCTCYKIEHYGKFELREPESSINHRTSGSEALRRLGNQVSASPAGPGNT